MHKTILISGVAIIAAILAGCGSTSGHGKSAAGRSVTDTVSLASVSGVGKVLVDSKGFALYSPAQEKSGAIRCTGSCASIWVPLTVKGSPQGSGLNLGTVMRPDGKTQVTFDGKPLYRFAEDNSPKSVSGNGVSDNFGGKSFTWHVASPGKTTASTGGGGYSSGY
jgi:predicted lipoprotein with Yx(FWY)xxD motif